MAAIDRDGVERNSPSYSPYRAPAQPGHVEEPRSSSETDPAMVFAAVTLLVASLVRLGPPFAGREAFGTEPTLALGATVGCGWLAVREGILRLRERLAARRAGAMVRPRTIE